jgi:alcohol dehydrogenase
MSGARAETVHRAEITVTPTLMRLITTGQIDASRFITHRFDLDDIEAAYDVLAHAADTKALKVVLT